jgi:NAD dependent epimerase/dehydratase family enzyme
MRILITGGTGFIGRPLCAALACADHEVTVLSREPATVRARCGPGVRALESLDGWRSDSVYDAVINLAGAPIIDARWSAARKRVLRDSRIGLTEALVRRIAANAHRPAVLLSGSAVGYYGDGGEVSLDEASPEGGGFAARLCADWEASAQRAASSGTRVCLLRTGLVLHPSGGLLGNMLCLLADPNASGAFNLTAPAPVTNGDFTRTLGHVLQRPVRFPMPAPLLRVLLGERAQMLLCGQRALPRKAEALGFRFAYPSLEPALRSGQRRI